MADQRHWVARGNCLHVNAEGETSRRRAGPARGGRGQSKGPGRGEGGATPGRAGSVKGGRGQSNEGVASLGRGGSSQRRAGAVLGRRGQSNGAWPVWGGAGPVRGGRCQSRGFRNQKPKNNIKEVDAVNNVDGGF